MADDPSSDPQTHRYVIRICDQCYALDGEMCHNPECIFCRRTMGEVRAMLDALLIRPIVDGQRLDMGPPQDDPALTDADAAREALQRERDEWQASFHLYAKATQALTKAWWEAHPEKRGVFPDTAKLCEWAAAALTVQQDLRARVAQIQSEREESEEGKTG